MYFVHEGTIFLSQYFWYFAVTENTEGRNFTNKIKPVLSSERINKKYSPNPWKFGGIKPLVPLTYHLTRVM